MIQFVLDSAQIIASAAVAVALYFTITTFRKMRKTEQIKLGEKLHSDMQHVRDEISKHMDIERQGRDYWDSKLKLLDEITFNTLEWNAFLIRTKQLTDKDLISHFKKVFLEWHDDVFVKTIENKDKSKYEQFQELVKELREGKYT